MDKVVELDYGEPTAPIGLKARHKQGANVRTKIAGIAIGVAAGALLGCVTTSKIVAAGPDTYMISAANDTCGNCTPPEIRATEQASAYCMKLGKTLVVKDTKEQTFDIGFGKRITLTFECK